MKALKEWASIVCALEGGAQTVLLRKGGIRDAPSGFREERGTFLLFPTYEHQSVGSLKNSGAQYSSESVQNAPPKGTVRISSVAEVLHAADVDAETAKRLSDFHIWSDSFITDRQKWMPEKPMRAIFVKTSTISPVSMPLAGEYSGCKSWLDIDSQATDSRAVLDSERLEGELEKFRGIVS